MRSVDCKVNVMQWYPINGLQVYLIVSFKNKDNFVTLSIIRVKYNGV